VRIAGRDEILREATAALATGHSVLLHGPSGIGKSTLMAVLAEQHGRHVLRAAPAETESGLPYLVLVDLFADLLPRFRSLPPHLREALEVALLRQPGAARPRDALTVRIAVLELLRRMASETPVLLVIDDVQWVDEASAEVLAFVARRLGDSQVTMLAAERVAEGEPTGIRLCPNPLRALAVEPLGYSGIVTLLAQESLPNHAVRRILQASGGNPLFAIELGRALARLDSTPAEHEPLPVPDRLRCLLAQRFSDLDEQTRRALLVAAAVARPTLSLLARCDVLPKDGLDSAEQARIVAVSAGGAIGFRHPLLRELIYSDATAAQRRSAHAAASAVVDEPVERIRHLALSSPLPEEATAALADEAAADAASRGALTSAAALARLAVERTPPDDVPAIAARLLEAARYADAAGHVAEARESAVAALAAGGTPATRVASRLLLIDLSGQDLSGAGAQLAAADEDAAGDIRLEAEVALYASSLAYFERRHADAEASAHRAEKLARLADDTDLVIRALGMQATMALTMGRTDSDELHATAYQLSMGRPVNPATVEARQSWAMTALFRGECTTAFDEITALENEVRQQGLVRDLMSVLISSAAVHGRAGFGQAALAKGRECARLFTDAGTAPGVGLIVAAGAEWCAGGSDAALESATEAMAICESIGDDEWLEVACAIRGQALLLAGRSADAVPMFTRAAELEAIARTGDPAIIPWHSDHIEALALTENLGAARDLHADLVDRAERYYRPVVRLALARAEAVIQCMEGDAGAADGLRAAIDAHGSTAYPLDLGRALLTVGRLDRRARRKASARTTLIKAVECLTAIAAEPWLILARRELDRLEHGTRPRSGELSEMERRIVDLVRSGATNREIASALYLSVKAVEAHLSRLYRRIGVRSRTDLLRALS
jgi:DNA-binding CsgD family transcriptional regulator